MIPQTSKTYQRHIFLEKWVRRPWTWPLGYGGWLDVSNTTIKTPGLRRCGLRRFFQQQNIWTHNNAYVWENRCGFFQETKSVWKTIMRIHENIFVFMYFLRKPITNSYITLDKANGWAWFGSGGGREGGGVGGGAVPLSSPHPTPPASSILNQAIHTRAIGYSIGNRQKGNRQFNRQFNCILSFVERKFGKQDKNRGPGDS